MLKLIKNAIYNQFLIDHTSRPFGGDLRAEESNITPVVMMVGLCDKYDVESSEVKEMLCLEDKSHKHKLSRFKEMINEGQERHLFSTLYYDDSVKRFYIKYLLCMNFIHFYQKDYVSNNELIKPYRR
jgi:hypothetical protein